MNKNNGIASVTYLPPCYCSHGGMGLDLVSGKYVWEDPYKPDKPVIVRFRGKKREALRFKWLWRIVARVQEAIAWV